MHTPHYVSTLLYTRPYGHGGEKKAINNKKELVLRATTSDNFTDGMTARGPRITAEQRLVELFDTDTRWQRT